MISHFLYLPLFLWQEHTFSTLFCISFCSGSSEWGVLSLVGQASALTSVTEDVLLPQPRRRDRLGENPSYVPLGKQLPQALVSLRIVIPTTQSCCENQMLCIEILVLSTVPST